MQVHGKREDEKSVDEQAGRCERATQEQTQVIEIALRRGLGTTEGRAPC
jgi:hypothetical protein